MSAPYSLDLRKRVLSYIASGSTRVEASKVFKISTVTIYNWINRKDLAPTPRSKRRKNKLDWQAVSKHVKDYPDALLKERAAHFKVSIRSIWYALNQLKISYKKNLPIPRGSSRAKKTVSKET